MPVEFTFTMLFLLFVLLQNGPLIHLSAAQILRYGLQSIRPEPDQIVYGATGSNIRIPGMEQDQQSGVIEWEFCQATEGPLVCNSIATHYFGVRNSPDVFYPYTQRISFSQSNGSFILHQLQKLDVGIYHMKVNLTKNRYIFLEVCEPIFDVFIFRVSLENNSLLLCCNFSGDADSIIWSMDGKNIPAGYKLMSGNRTLQVPSTVACALFQCEVANVFSKQLSNSRSDREDELCKGINNSETTVILFAVLMILIIAAGLGYCYYRKRKRNRTTITSPQEMQELGMQAEDS